MVQVRPRKRKGPLSHLSSITIATLACGLTTLVASWLLQVFDLSNIVMLFLLTVVFVALWLGRVAGGWAAFLCVACLDFFFVEPRLSFAVSDTQYVFTFALMFAVALVISQLAVRLKSEAKIATAGERRATAIARVARDLTAAIETSQVMTICSETDRASVRCAGRAHSARYQRPAHSRAGQRIHRYACCAMGL